MDIIRFSQGDAFGAVCTGMTQCCFFAYYDDILYQTKVKYKGDKENIMNWFERAKEIFDVPKPEHFTNYEHCDEYFEHDETLRQYTIDKIGIEQLGNSASDPITFSSSEGKKYYFPALVKLTLDTMESEFYLEQLLFTLESNGENNAFYQSCNTEQRIFVKEFIEHIIKHYSSYIDNGWETDSLLRVHEIWSKL